MEVDQQEVLQQDVVEYQESENFKSPMKLMKEWIPACEGGLLPKEGLVFDNLEQCENFYKTYAHHVGFSVRKSSCKKTKDGVEKYKYYVCSKEGFMENSTNAKSKGKDKVRNRKLTREGCNALAAFKRNEDGKYVLFRFYEGHTHLLATPKKRHMLKSNARVKSVHRALFKSYTRANVGPTRAHRYMKEQVGGFEHVGCSKQALKNFQRDLKAYIKDSDAHMFVENLKRKKEVNKSFYYAYELDDEQRLKHIFWADGISRKNYALYGDVVSFDTTFDTNRYKMIFAPFTGIDNHRHCVTFGAAFLGDEKSESFIWLFDKFLEAMGNHKPICIITDQDPAMKVAIQKVFDTSTHRLCMWHIMKKLSEKVGCSLNADSDFNTLTLNGISNVKKHVMELKGSTSERKIQELESFIGSSAPEQVEIHPPKQSHTKGGGKRIKGGKEEAMEKQKKKRVCHACGEEGNHDRRNCPSKLSA